MNVQRVLFKGLTKILKNKEYAARLSKHQFGSVEYFRELEVIRKEIAK